MNLSQAIIDGKGITLSEALETGGVVTLTGMSIVFGVLVILMIVLMLFKLVFGRSSAKKAAASTQAPAAVPAPESKADEDMDDDELIAVLTAAVAASLNTSTYNLQIKSYRRIDTKKPAWNKAGIRETINNRF